MPPPADILRSIDRICDTFEQQLGHDNRRSIQKALDEFTPAWRGELQTALIQVDLEHRIRNQTANPLERESFLRHYVVENYGWVKPPDDCLYECGAFEFTLRQSKWGTPHLDCFVENCPVDQTPLYLSIWRRLNQITPTTVQLGANFQTTLDKRLVFGRRQKHQPDPVRRLSGELNDLIVMASADRRYLSRSQITIERISASEIRVANTGSQNDVYINTVSQVSPGEARTAAGPLLVQVREYSIQVTPEK